MAPSNHSWIKLHFIFLGQSLMKELIGNHIIKCSFLFIFWVAFVFVLCFYLYSTYYRKKKKKIACLFELGLKTWYCPPCLMGKELIYILAIVILIHRVSETSICLFWWFLFSVFFLIFLMIWFHLIKKWDDEKDPLSPTEKAIICASYLAFEGVNCKIKENWHTRKQKLPRAPIHL